MTRLPGKAAAPFTPTVNDNGHPTTCYVCARHAWGVGLTTKGKDPHYICKGCAVAIDDYRKIERLDDYELAALDAGVAAVGEYIGTHGVTDLSHFDDLMQRMMVKAAWEGCARGVREALRRAG